MGKKIKKDIVKEVAKSEKKSERDVGGTVNAFIDEVRDNLIDGNDVALNTLGTFSVEDQAGKTVANNLPGQNTTHTVKPTKVVKFHVSKKLQDTVKEKTYDGGNKIDDE